MKVTRLDQRIKSGVDAPALVERGIEAYRRSTRAARQFWESLLRAERQGIDLELTRLGCAAGSSLSEDAEQDRFLRFADQCVYGVALERRPPAPPEPPQRPRLKPGDPTTDPQRAIFNHFLAETTRNFYQPSLREVADHFGMAVNGVVGHLRALEKKGLLQLAGGNGRAIRFHRRAPIE